MDFSTMDTNILAVIISSLIYVFFAILNWCRQKIVIWYTNRKLFETYKEYAKECLEKLIYYYKNKKIIYDVVPNEKKEYNLGELSFQFVMESGNKVELINQVYIMAIIVSFIGEREFLDNTEQNLLRRILSKMTPNAWLVRAKHVDPETNHQIEFTNVLIYDKGTPLSQINSSIYFKTLANVNKDFLEKILEQLENEKFDDRIRKIIKKGVQ